MTEAVTTPAHLFHLVSDTLFDIRAVRICSDEILEVDYSNLKENQPDNGRVNIFVATFGTCWAWSKLYSYLQQLQQQVLYFDTDLVMYSCKPGQPDILLGNYLGDMTDKLEGDDCIADFVSGAKELRLLENCSNVTDGFQTEFSISNAWCIV